VIEINYNGNDYVTLLHTIARSFKIDINRNSVRIPAEAGEGFFSAYNLPNRLSILLSDVFLNDGVILHREIASNQQFFILQFNESIDSVIDISSRRHEQYVYEIQKNGVLLTSSLMDTKLIMPAKIRVRSVRIILGNDFLNSLIGNEMADKFLSNYFSLLLKNQHFELIGTDYRVIMDDLIKERLDHPLKLKFIQNRIMLLIEKLVTGFITKLEKNTTIKLKDDEIRRLIKVETLLVKDYTGTPPLIIDLSKVAAMSPTKLKKDFKAMYGLPIYEYYQRNRMMHARALLMEGKYAVKEVGMMVGYSNLGHFAGSFKKAFGILPSETISKNHP
jgi:AraC-like DNA-binding protein